MRARKTASAHKKRGERNGDHRQKKFGRGLFHHQKKLLHYQKSKNSLLLCFFSYAVLPTSEIVFSTSEVDFSVSELFSAVVVGGHISATLSISDIRPLQGHSLRHRAVRRFVVLRLRLIRCSPRDGYVWWNIMTATIPKFIGFNPCFNGRGSRTLFSKSEK